MVITVEDKLIFLSWDNHNKLEEIAREKMKSNPSWVVESIHPESKEYAEKISIYRSRILSLRNDHPEKFEKELLNINLKGRKAQENCWKVLYEYCRKNNSIFLKDNRSLQSQIESDYIGDSYGYYPIGKKFDLTITLPTSKNWYGKIVSKGMDFDILINTQSVTRISGNFDELIKIFFVDFKLILGRGISVQPLVD